MTRRPSSFTDPIPTDGRLIRAVRTAALRAHQARELVRVARETGGRVDHSRDEARNRRFEFPEPADLRGIPALGPGVGGAIRGTRPGDNLDDYTGRPEPGDEE